MREKILKTKLLLWIIVALAFFLRVYRVGDLPPSLSWDEASIGYNAFSILKTGHDEHRRFLPLDTFVAFGDYKPPIVIYLTVPSVAIFGLNEFAVRLPAVTAGTLTVLFVYFLVSELFVFNRLASRLSLLVSFLLTISPWHLQLSRAGFEANTALFFVVLSAWLVLKARRNYRLLLVCWLPFVVAFYTFNSARYFTPLLALGLLIYAGKDLRAHKRELLLGVVIAGLALLPILPHFISPEARLRFTEVNIFTDSSIVRVANERINAEDRAWWARILHNRRLGYARSYLIHFFDHFETSFLFMRGDGNPKLSIQDVGQLYLAELPFLVLGVYWLLAKDKRLWWLLVFWLLSAIVPAATARETPHSLRIENSLPIWQIFIAYGIISLITNQITRKRKILFLALVCLLYLGNFGYYWHNYYNHYAKEYSGEWQHGYREAIRFAMALESRYDDIVISEIIGRPYIYLLFYKQYNPSSLWSEIDASFDAAGFYNVYSIGKYRFVRSDKGALKRKTLYIFPPGEVPQKVRILFTIRVLNGTPVLVAFDSL